jgi:hypothetical protein
VNEEESQVLKIKLKGCHFDRTEVIEEGLQAVLNTLTKHNLQGAFKNDRSTWNGAYERKGTTIYVQLFLNTASTQTQVTIATNCRALHFFLWKSQFILQSIVIHLAEFMVREYYNVLGKDP